MRNDDPQYPDIDPQETADWIDSLQAVLQTSGVERAHFLMEQLLDVARRNGVHLPYSPNTSYLNTIPVSQQTPFPGTRSIERRIKSIIRWNAMAMVVKANQENHGIGGHISSFASAATLYEVGFNHFFRGPEHPSGGDLIYFQGHSAPGIYSRAFLEGRLSVSDLNNFRRELAEEGGLSSYPHPWLMPDFWQFATVSMGLAPIMAIYQARFMRYMIDRGLLKSTGRKIWAFLGDGEMDEPESLGALTLAAREQLDNLIFIVNCNLQRLDGPVRGNGKVIQELEGAFRGAGWNVIKVVWGSAWDELLAKDTDGLLVRRMNELVDGDSLKYIVEGGAYIRKHFFGKHPQLLKMVEHLTDEELWKLNLGGHDPAKVFAAYDTARKHKGQPTVILARTIKGYGLSEAGEGRNITHQQKQLNQKELLEFRNRFNIPLSDEECLKTPFYKPSPDSEEMLYLSERRESLGGYQPHRSSQAAKLPEIKLSSLEPLLKSSGERQYSTTMALVRALTILTKDSQIGQHIVPIIPDEARTFGIDPLFRQLGTYSRVGQLYDPVDSDQYLYYREDVQGQILEEGITEAGGISSFIAAGMSYSTNGVPMVPFFIYYSMFGFQRVGDFIWAAADMRTRGFLIGGTAGRTTLAGEGLQHQDGHSHLAASVVPTIKAYDPAFAYEIAVIIQDGMKRMFTEQEEMFYYITVGNENYHHPALPDDIGAGIIKGMYPFSGSKTDAFAGLRLLGSGAILHEVIAAAQMLKKDWNIAAEVWSVTSYSELRKEAEDVQRWNLLNTSGKPRQSYLAQCLNSSPAPVVAVSDYVKLVAEQIAAYLDVPFTSLGTDGFGRSDTRSALRDFFEVDRRYIVLAALNSLVQNGQLTQTKIKQALKKYKINPDKSNPLTV